MGFCFCQDEENHQLVYADLQLETPASNAPVWGTEAPTEYVAIDFNKLVIADESVVTSEQHEHNNEN